ncbi:hypothetical protein [Anaerotignum propionicum]|uniref:hypothetical protein n=1 Tax=Anaerotignum propionicum TaxID=28446 RepID=UPI0028A00EB4|nr:hypothetical protein [Anaerotignum propionicum]
MYVLEAVGSATIFAGILAMATFPTILLSVLGGILADRANRKIIMVALDTLTGISILGATLLFSGSNGIVVIGVLLILLSIWGPLSRQLFKRVYLKCNQVITLSKGMLL